MTQENNIQESKRPLRTLLMVLLFISILIGSVLLPVIPLYILNIKFSILRYIHSALSCCVLMVLYIVLEMIITKNKINNENSTKSN
jgi:hypothetical protein